MDQLPKDVVKIIDYYVEYDKNRLWWFGLKQGSIYECFYVFNTKYIYCFNYYVEPANAFNTGPRYYNSSDRDCVVDAFKIERDHNQTIEQQCCIFEEQLLTITNDITIIRDEGLLNRLCKTIISYLTDDTVIYFEIIEPEEIEDGISYEEYEQICDKILKEGVRKYNYTPTDKRIK